MPSVLVVDDAAVDRRLAGGLLEKSIDLKISYAASGLEALQALDAETPDIVLTDLQMPDIDGLALLNTIHERHPEVPVVLMTAHGSENLAAQALAQGAACYVPKSELADNLVETVTQILAMSATDQRYRRLIGCSTKTLFEFQLDNDLELIEPLVDWIQQIAASMNLCDATQRVRLGVALEHALQNAMIRGNLEISRSSNNIVDRDEVDRRRRTPPYRDRRVEFHVLITRDEGRFTVRDQGPGFDTSRVPMAADPESLRDGCGRGLVLMRSFLDAVEFNDAGNEVTLMKRRA